MELLNSPQHIQNAEKSYPLKGRKSTVIRDLSSFWSLAPEELQRQLNTKQEGLDESEAQERLKQYGANFIEARKKSYPSFCCSPSSRAP